MTQVPNYIPIPTLSELKEEINLAVTEAAMLGRNHAVISIDVLKNIQERDQKFWESIMRALSYARDGRISNIQLIKAYRAATGSSLKESNEKVQHMLAVEENLFRQMKQEHSQLA